MLDSQRQEIKDKLESKRLLEYINEFWEAFSKEEKNEILQILIKMMNRNEKGIEKLIKSL